MRQKEHQEQFTSPSLSPLPSSSPHSSSPPSTPSSPPLLLSTPSSPSFSPSLLPHLIEFPHLLQTTLKFFQVPAGELTQLRVLHPHTHHRLVGKEEEAERWRGRRGGEGEERSMRGKKWWAEEDHEQGGREKDSVKRTLHKDRVYSLLYFQS